MKTHTTSAVAVPPTRRILFALLALLASVLGTVGSLPTAWAQPAADDLVTVRGNAAYRVRIAMPPDAVLAVRIEDVSRADAAAKVLVETREAIGTRQVPLPFELKLPRAAIDPRARYSLRATITVGDELKFTTDRHYPVLMQDAPDLVNLMLVPVERVGALPCAPREQWVIDRLSGVEASAGCVDEVAPTGTGTSNDVGTDTGISTKTTTASLKDTYWKLIEIDGQAIAAPPATQREVRITLASGGTRVFGFTGCNNLMGTYTQEGSALRFTQLSGTRKSCVAPVMALEARVHETLRATTHCRIEAQTLTLLAGTQPIARFEAVYLQ